MLNASITSLCATSHRGGAALAAVRLHRALRGHVANIQFVALSVQRFEPGIAGLGAYSLSKSLRWRLALDQIPRWLSGGYGTEQFNTALGPSPFGLREAVERSDIVHLHWIGKGMLPLRALRRMRKPIVWTLHDMWPITGGCHYDSECGRFAERCGRCPILRSHRPRDLSRYLIERKRLIYGEVRPTFIAPSRWIADAARKSRVGVGGAISVIPNTLDRTIFAPNDREATRRTLRLPVHAMVIAFAAMGGGTERRKGFDLLKAALRELSTAPGRRPLHLLVIGGPGRDDAPIPITGTGHLDGEDAVARALSAADVLVAPSRQDNLPNTVAEALACGVPAVAFNVGGLPDLITHYWNGYLARPFDTADLARGIAWVLQDPERHTALRAAARESTVRFSPERVAAQHIELYQEILDRHRGAAAS